MLDLLANLGERYDVLILDAPPLLPVSDAAVLAAICRRCAAGLPLR